VVLTIGRGGCLPCSGLAQLVEPEALRQKRSAPVSSGSACSESPCPQSPLPESGAFAALILEFAVGVIVKVLDRAGCLPARSCHDAGRWYL
jgi:hypothetical protein